MSRSIIFTIPFVEELIKILFHEGVSFGSNFFGSIRIHQIFKKKQFFVWSIIVSSFINGRYLGSDGWRTTFADTRQLRTVAMVQFYYHNRCEASAVTRCEDI